MAPTLTLQDIADLARVQRPVVSTWRKRSQGQGHPFPKPVKVHNRQEFFDRLEIVEWLERTGLGNNPDFSWDAAALSVPDDVPVEDLEVLLCLAALAGRELAETTADERVRLARDIDPDNQTLLAEVTTMWPSTEALGFIDDLREASFGPSEALQRLEASRASRRSGQRDLSKEAHELVRTVIAACARHLDPEGVPLIHAAQQNAATIPIDRECTRLIVPGDSPRDRALRRRALLYGIDTTRTVATPAVRLLSIVGESKSVGLQQLDDIILEMGENDIAVILGPADLLCDGLQGGHDKDRAHTLRPGVLAAALRLPRGLWREAHRQALGLWVCRQNAAQPFIADLSALTDHELNLADLTTDIVAALATPKHRAFAYLRRHQLASILTSRVAVVPRGVLAQRSGAVRADHVAAINATTLNINQPIQPFDVLAQPTGGPTVLRRQSLEELRSRTRVTVLRGSRFKAEEQDPAGSVEVLTADSPEPIMRLDPFDADRLYPRAVRTEPGDVIFLQKPRPAARVDDHGGSLVSAPSRILRIDPRAGIGPHAVAAVINRLPDHATEWKAWNVPIPDPAEVERLEAVLIAAAAHEVELRRHLAAMRNLTTAMIDGVAAGAVTLSTRTTE